MVVFENVKARRRYNKIRS